MNDVSNNQISAIVGSTFQKITNFSSLNLIGNQLHSLPKEMTSLKTTKIYVERNKFNCHDCFLAETLSEIRVATPQNISCKAQQNFDDAEFICLIVNTAIPSCLSSLALFSLIMAIYQTILKYNFKRLAKKLLDTYHEKKDFERYCSIWQQLDHGNIRKLHRFRTTWMPIKTRWGHLFCEKITFYLKDWPTAAVILKPLNMARELLMGIEYLHSRPSSIFHRNILHCTLLVCIEAPEM